MSSWLEGLPSDSLDALVTSIIEHEPSTRKHFLTSLGRRVHESVSRVVYRTVTLEDNSNAVGSSGGSNVRGLLANGLRYGPLVRRIHIGNIPVPQSKDEPVLNLLDASSLDAILSHCPGLEELRWESHVPPHDGICETLALYNPRLSSFVVDPAYSQGHDRLVSKSRVSSKKWDAPSLPLLSTLPLVKLQVTRLTQPGSRALLTLLESMGEFSTLEDVTLDFVWLDDSICEGIVQAGKRLRRLQLSTAGTKLDDKGIISILEGCEALESLLLNEVEGRLSRTLWSKPNGIPSSIQRLEVTFDDAGPNHSWTPDHLLSIAAFPIENLTHLSLVRTFKPSLTTDDVPTFAESHDDESLARVPEELIGKLKDAHQLRELECDWWGWTADDIKAGVERRDRLTHLRISFAGPFSKFLHSSSTFATAPSLVSVKVKIPPQYAPGRPPAPIASMKQYQGPPTPNDSPVQRSKAVLPQLLDHDQMNSQTSVSAEVSGDPSMPHVREIKKFARKVPKLDVFEWYGRNGRGVWSISRVAGVKSSTCVVGVTYTPPVISSPVWDAMAWERDMASLDEDGWLDEAAERPGREWTSQKAEELAREQSNRDDKDERSVSFERPPKLKNLGRTERSHSPESPTTRRGCEFSQVSSEDGASPLSPPQSASSISAFGPSEAISSPTSTPVKTRPNRTQNHSSTEETVTAKSDGTGSGNGSARNRRATSSGTKPDMSAQGHPRHHGRHRSMSSSAAPTLAMENREGKSNRGMTSDSQTSPTSSRRTSEHTQNQNGTRGRGRGNGSKPRRSSGRTSSTA